MELKAAAGFDPQSGDVPAEDKRLWLLGILAAGELARGMASSPKVRAKRGEDALRDFAAELETAVREGFWMIGGFPPIRNRASLVTPARAEAMEVLERGGSCDDAAAAFLKSLGTMKHMTVNARQFIAMLEACAKRDRMALVAALEAAD